MLIFGTLVQMRLTYVTKLTKTYNYYIHLPLDFFDLLDTPFFFLFHFHGLNNLENEDFLLFRGTGVTVAKPSPLALSDPYDTFMSSVEPEMKQQQQKKKKHQRVKFQNFKT